MCNPITTLRPDLLLAKGVHLGFEWEVTHNEAGHRCGYVRLPKGHPAYGCSDWLVEVHGGLNFGERDYDCGKGGEDDGWWVGFHCAYWTDLPDPELPNGKRMMELNGPYPKYAAVRTTEYVTKECQKVCEAAAALAAARC
jgi:hypothetical protein